MNSEYPAAAGIFFDVDDTLYDHLLPFRQAVEAVLAPGGEFPYEAAYHRMRHYSDVLSAEQGGAGAMGPGRETEEMRVRRFQLALGEFGFSLSGEQAAAMQAAYIGCQFRIGLWPGMRELLERLAAAGRLAGVITNGEENHQRRKIAALGIEGFFPPERQFISGAVGVDKPDPRLFAHAAERCGLAPEDCLYVGDSWRNDVAGALKAGWRVVWFNHRKVEPGPGGAPTRTAESVPELSRLLLETP